jgi:hypothetical protein
MILTLTALVWVLLWTSIILVRVILHVTRDKFYDLENSALYKAIKTKWDSVP